MLLNAAAAALLLASAPARAAFEPSVGSARAQGLGGAMTAVADDPVSQLYNPATLGALDDGSVSVNFLRQFHTPAGEVDQEHFSLLGAVPVKQEIIDGTFGLGAQYTSAMNGRRERTYRVGYGTRGLWTREDRRLDAGGAFKLLKLTTDGGRAPLRPALDVGMLYRWSERYAFGASLLNFNGPPVEANGYRDRVPAEIRFGFAESVRGFTLAFDVAKREPSGHHAGTAEAAAGFERWWATTRAGSFAARTGLSVGDHEKDWSWGFGWRVMGGQIDYAMTVPISGTTKFGHAISIAFRFGQSNPEAEYEKVLATEIRYRKDLVEALEAGEVKQWKLAEELSRLREELDALRQKLAAKTGAEAETRKRLQDLQDRHKRALETFERLKSESTALKGKTKQALFDEDWSAYNRLKLSGAPDNVLVEHVKKLLQQYKDTGVDLSGANQELVRLLRNR